MYSTTPKEIAPVPAKPLYSDPRKAGFSMLNKGALYENFLADYKKAGFPAIIIAVN
jgi:hypothetical protein